MQSRLWWHIKDEVINEFLIFQTILCLILIAVNKLIHVYVVFWYMYFGGGVLLLLGFILFGWVGFVFFGCFWGVFLGFFVCLYVMLGRSIFIYLILFYCYKHNSLTIKRGHKDILHLFNFD